MENTKSKQGQLFEDFTNQYSVSKTLRFELRPIGRTKEFIEREGILSEDTQKAEDYIKVKKIIDQFHKKVIEESLSNVELEGLSEYLNLYCISKRDEKQEKEFEAVKASLRKQIVKLLGKHPDFAYLGKKELFKDKLLSFVKTDEEWFFINEFMDFTTYFTGFNTNRENMYSAEAKSTSIAFRLIDQNLPKFIDNMKSYQLLNGIFSEEEWKDKIEKLAEDISTPKVASYFDITGFNCVLTQKGIDEYNLVLGGFSRENKEKIQGLNEIINLFNQKNPERKIPKMKMLFKQILSDKEKHSFIPEKFDNIKDLVNAVNDFTDSMEKVLFTEDKGIMNIIRNLSSMDLRYVFVNNDASINTISQILYGDWSVIQNAISEKYDTEFGGLKKNTEKYAETKKKALKKNKFYNIYDLNDWIETYAKQEKKVEDFFIDETERLCNLIETAEVEYQDVSRFNDEGTKTEKRVLFDKIKSMLDLYLDLLHMIKMLIAGNESPEKDGYFYSELVTIYEKLDVVIALYNKVRNFVTQKPYSTEKVKLNFGKATLLDGWDKNKERDNLGILFQRKGQYYLGIMNRKCNKIMVEAPDALSDDIYQKVEYKLLPGPNKMLPKVFFSKSRIDEFAPDASIVENYEKGTHKKGNDFSLEDCHRLIDFFKLSLKKHEDWSEFNFDFSPTKTYQDISGFYREVEHQGYKITFKDIDAAYIDDLVENGQLYLFQIYNKDFSKYSKGTPNLHTLYWKMLFSEDNLKNVVYKLNGQAEVFYRKASITDNIIVHKAKEPIVNKYPNAEKKTSIFDYELVKDKRYTVDKFQFHVPITMNFQATDEKYINRKVRKVIHTAEDIHVIGIDRGERNLLYISVIDRNGNIVEQRSLNSIMTCSADGTEHAKDYHLLLDNREKENKGARKNWTTVNTIKELKEGYLSQVVHEVTMLMVKYNAIIVMEDLNFGFKRGRQKVEKQVYQKFEKMLIDKLNYLVDKRQDITEKGGLLKAYQLTDKFESFQKLGKQTGFLFYVPAWNTSKMDPTTGFVNLFYTKYESIDKTRNFINKFSDIRYNSASDYFEFLFDYSKFTYKAEGSRTDWCLATYGKRIETFRNVEKNSNWDTKEIDLTTAWKDLFKEYEICWNDAELMKQLCQLTDASFYKKFMRLFGLTVQLRNSDDMGNDYIASPVKNKAGIFFNSNEQNGKKQYPLDADANGAYNIAKKGMWLIKQMQEADVEKLDKVKLAMTNKEWLQFAQQHVL